MIFKECIQYRNKKNFQRFIANTRSSRGKVTWSMKGIFPLLFKNNEEMGNWKSPLGITPKMQMSDDTHAARFIPDYLSRLSATRPLDIFIFSNLAFFIYLASRMTCFLIPALLPAWLRTIFPTCLLAAS
jgi:hypothetical protein